MRRSDGLVLAWLVAVASVSAAPPWGLTDNPRITVRIENATGHEAIAALARAAGVPIRHYHDSLTQEQAARRKVENPADWAILEERARFDWKDVRFAQALRELCNRYRLTPNGYDPDAFMLLPGGPGPAAPGPRIGLFEKQGVTIWVTAVSTGYSHARRLSFDNVPPEKNENSFTSLSLDLTGRLEDLDFWRLAGVDRATARDDHGTVLQSIGPLRFGSGRVTGAQPGYPDGWDLSLAFSGLHPRAKKLAWVEGELLAYRVLRRHRIQFNLPAEPGADPQRMGDAIIELIGLTPGEGPPSGPEVELRLFVPFAPDTGRVVSEFGLGRNENSSSRMRIYGASGKVCGDSEALSWSAKVKKNGMQHVIRGYFRPVQEPITRVEFLALERAQPEPWVSFRLTNIPLPEAGLAPAGAQGNAPQALERVP